MIKEGYINIKICLSLRNALKAKAAKEGLTIREAMNLLISKYVRE